eukprot:CAMPEP_0183751980 /NCGR_PEP_ID=MMETSP0739-20130205/2079_1 /TAXON_ID=385413 /ORGANISM="Thalassiosira miniscula, Strain CCMP1093" /LENGTH=215 /DNA_ID=CAMNT_0025988283 /DNA_START=64 /DNA_END=708 /DNA_ORIENTATION=+
MALHSAKHGFSNPIHGIALGKKSNADDSQLEVVDVVPVCHEVPTKPIVDMALRLTDAYLQQKPLEGVKIVGWYTANANALSSGSNNEEELPNAPACRICSSMAENSSDDNGTVEDFLLLLVSTPRLVDCVKGAADETPLPICTVFEKGNRSRTFTQKVDDSRLVTVDSKEILSKAVQQIVSEGGIRGGDAAGGGGSDITIYDFVDHLAECGEGNW